MCETMMEPRDNFVTREAHWELVRGTKERVVVGVGNQPAEFYDTLEEAAEQMSAMLKRTILAMPQNGALVLTLDGRWS